jgi:tetratricopeptide (TPR) repeat protein
VSFANRLFTILVSAALIVAALAALVFWPKSKPVTPVVPAQVDERAEKEWAALNQQGLTIFSAGRIEESRSVFETSMIAAHKLYPKTTFPNGHQNLATAMTNLGAVYKALNQFELASPPYEDALAVCRSLHPDGHHSVVTAANNLASLRMAQKRFDDAEKLLIPALAMAKRLFPGDHPLVAQQLNNLGLLRHAQGDLDQAVVLFTEAYTMYGKTGSPFQPGSILALNNLAFIAVEQKRFTDAEAHFRTVLDLCRTGNSSDNPATMSALVNLEKVYTAMGKTDEAAKYHGLAFAMQWRLWWKSQSKKP